MNARRKIKDESIRYNITLRVGRYSKNWNGTATGLRAAVLVAFGLGLRHVPGVDHSHNGDEVR